MLYAPDGVEFVKAENTNFEGPGDGLGVGLWSGYKGGRLDIHEGLRELNKRTSWLLFGDYCC